MGPTISLPDLQQLMKFIALQTSDDTLIAILNGRSDATPEAVGADLREAVEQAASDGRKRVNVDFRNLATVSSDLLGQFVVVHQFAKKCGILMQVQQLPPGARDTLPPSV